MCSVCNKIAIERVTDQKVLADIAKSSYYGEAVAKLHNQSMLVDVAKNASSEVTRNLAVQKILDEALLLEVVNNCEYMETRILAAQKLPDQSLVQSLYAYVAKNDYITYKAKEAINKLTDQALLADVVTSKSNADSKNAQSVVRAEAAYRLTDQTLLAKIAKKVKDLFILEIIVEKLTDQSALAYVAKNNCFKGSFARTKAIERLTDQSVLEELIKDKDIDIQMKANKRLSALK